MTQQVNTPPATDDGEWWRHAVIYQIYPRSFNDSNGDGMGDIPGIIERLDYLADLGVDALWLSPFYVSPQNDAGYDVSDYRDIDPRFGTLEDFDRMRARMDELGLRLIVDLVPNHTSSDHEWFRAAVAAGPGSPERARYMFRDGRGEDGELPPNNWRSIFGGEAWTRLPDGQWYLHLFDSTQPDLNWENPEVWEEFRSVLRFWLDRGADGFRVDVAHGLVKAEGLPDWDHQVHMVEGEFEAPEHDEPDTPMHGTSPYFDQDGVHEVYRDWHRVLAEYDGDRMMVAEAWVEPAHRLAMYVRSDEMHQAFNFDFLIAGWDWARMSRAIEDSLAESAKVGAPTTWVLSNHDTVRHVSRFGLSDPIAYPKGIDAGHEQPDHEQGLARGRSAALVELALPGSAYLYQGDELGLPDHTGLPAELRQDPAFARTQGEEIGRDGCRVPLPWAAGEPGHGFGEDPWLPQPEAFAALAADQQVGVPDSTHTLYRTAIRLRRELGLGRGDFAWHEAHDAATRLLAFVTTTPAGERVLVAANMGEEPVALPEGELLVTSREGAVTDGALGPESAAWVRLAPLVR
ncbi:alpha-glucosidase [Kocuria dechangensis]|uniref:Alpha-glucosidase n=1 Tax=Kocuria dechangensis TaxID=1176249 RepID=A0A917LP67_9MICC|nr:glycoside hydrolase family 13 protein [Kocuria dechangensis]GGG48233.1 alpha-glucosidase [Kocuria dechangensis]